MEGGRGAEAMKGDAVKLGAVISGVVFCILTCELAKCFDQVLMFYPERQRGCCSKNSKGPMAQWKSVPFTPERSLVRTQLGPHSPRSS